MDDPKIVEGCGRLFDDGDYWAQCGDLSLHGFIDLCGICREEKRQKVK